MATREENWQKSKSTEDLTDDTQHTQTINTEASQGHKEGFGGGSELSNYKPIYCSDEACEKTVEEIVSGWLSPEPTYRSEIVLTESDLSSEEYGIISSEDRKDSDLSDEEDRKDSDLSDEEDRKDSDLSDEEDRKDSDLSSEEGFEIEDWEDSEPPNNKPNERSEKSSDLEDADASVYKSTDSSLQGWGWTPEKLAQLEEDRYLIAWTHMVKNWTRFEHIIQTHMNKGIPDSIRGEVWKHMLQLEHVRSDGVYRAMKEIGRVSSHDVRQIDMNVLRTCRDKYGIKLQALLNVFRAYSQYNSALQNYCQGMSNIAAVLLMYLNEEDAFWAMVVLIGSPKFAMHGLLIPGLPKLLVYCDYHKTMRKQFLPKLDQHLTTQNVEPIDYCTPWFINCYLDSLPFRLVMRIWDVMFYHGEVVLIAMSLVILKLNRESFLCNDEDDIRIAMQELDHNVYNEDEVITELNSMIIEISKTRKTIPQCVELQELSVLNAQAQQRGEKFRNLSEATPMGESFLKDEDDIKVAIEELKNDLYNTKGLKVPQHNLSRDGKKTRGLSKSHLKRLNQIRIAMWKLHYNVYKDNTVYKKPQEKDKNLASVFEVSRTDEVLHVQEVEEKGEAICFEDDRENMSAEAIHVLKKLALYKAQLSVKERCSKHGMDQHKEISMDEPGKLEEKITSNVRKAQERVVYGEYLQCDENKISASISPTDLPSFCSKLELKELIPVHVQENLATMHPDVSHHWKCKYVLQYVYESVDRSRAIFYSFLRILSKFPKCKRIYEKLSKLGDPVPAGIDTAEGQSSILQTHHVGCLLDYLSIYSHKWEYMAILLLNNGTTVEHFQSKYLNDFKKCLYLTLEAWLSGQERYGLPPTLNSIQKVLRSDLVQLPKVADDLTDQLIQTWDVSFQGGSGQGSSGAASESDDEDDSKTDVEVPRTITFLELEESAGVVLPLGTWRATKIHKWFKDGVPLYNSKQCPELTLYFGVLHLLLSDIGAEGQYKYEHVQGSKSINLVIKTPIDKLKLKQVLVTRYCHSPVIDEDSWPITKQNTFIKLAVVTGQKDLKGDTFYCETIQGDSDDILFGKSPTDYDVVFRALDFEDRVLLEGRPGSGKTTLVHKISQDWANGKFKWSNLRLLFVVYLRGFQNDPNIGLKDIISRYFENPAHVEAIIDYAYKHNGLGIGFVLDGMDEYQPENVRQTYVSKLIERAALPRALVIVASRPAAVACYRAKAKSVIEVLGFFKKQINDYIKSYQFSDVSKASSLKKYLNHHPNIHNMCYLPIQTAMICFLFDKCGDKLPETETEIYSEFTRHSLLRTLYKCHMEGILLKSMFDLPAKEKKHFNQICALAFTKTCDSKQVLMQSEITSLKCRTMSLDEIQSLGLVTIDKAATMCGFENVYTFCHLTMQEFLAACHLSLLSDAEQMEAIEKYGGKKHMQVVFKFYCGLVKFGRDCVKFRALLKQSSDMLQFIQCSYESKQKHTCRYVTETNCLDLLHLPYLPARDWVAIRKVIASAENIVEFKLNFCQHEENFKSIIKAARTSSIKSLHIKHNSVQKSSTNDSKKHFVPYYFIDLICSMINSHIENLVLRIILPEYKLGQYGITELSKSLMKCNNLQSLDISNNNLSDGQMEVVGQRLPPNLSSLDVSSNRLSVSGTTVLIQTLFFYKTSRESVNNTSSDDTTQLIPKGHSNSKLTALDLSSNKLSDGGFEYLGEQLLDCISLRSLNLSRNRHTRSGGVTTLVQALPHSALTSLDLSRNKISDGEVMRLAQALAAGCCLTSLYISHNEISDNGVKSLADCLHKSNSLEMLDLSYNRICDKGEQSVVVLLLKNSALTHVDLSGNTLFKAGKKAVIEFVQSRKNLDVKV